MFSRWYPVDELCFHVLWIRKKRRKGTIDLAVLKPKTGGKKGTRVSLWLAYIVFKLLIIQIGALMN